MVAIQEKVDRIEQEVFHIRNEVRSDIEAKFIQIEQKLEKYAKEVDDKLQVIKSETFLFLESKNEQLETSVDHKIENVQWSDLFRGLMDDDVQLTSAVDKCIENKMSLISQEINTAQNIIKDTRLQANEERDKERRKNNIVLYRVPESNANLLKDRNAEDIKTVLRFLKHGCRRHKIINNN